MTFSTRSTCNPSGRLCGQSSATCLSKLLMCFFGTLPISDSAIRFVFGHALRLLGCKWWWSHLKIGASGRWDLHCFYLCRSHFTCADWQVYLSPFVKAMSPPEAAALRPLLEKKASSFCTSSQYIWHENCEGWLPVFKQAVDDIYYDMDMDHTADISSDEMLSWSKRGNNIVDRLADIIDQEVYQIWLTESKKKVTNMRRSYDSPGSPHSGVYNPQDGDMPGSMRSMNGTQSSAGHGGSPMSHSEYGPPPHSTSPQGQNNGWFGGYFNGNQPSPASRTDISWWVGCVRFGLLHCTLRMLSLRSPMSSPPPASAPVNVHDPFHDPFVPGNEYGQIHMAACDMCLPDEVLQRVDSVSCQFSNQITLGCIFQVINFREWSMKIKLWGNPTTRCCATCLQTSQQQLVFFEEIPPVPRPPPPPPPAPGRAVPVGVAGSWRGFFPGFGASGWKNVVGKRNEVLSEDVHVKFQESILSQLAFHHPKLLELQDEIVGPWHLHHWHLTWQEDMTGK